MISDVSILILSCDKYADLWPIFIKYFKRNWPDCNYELLLVSNTIEPNFPGINNILVGQDISWSKTLKKALEKIPTKYVFIFLDDVFIDEPVNSKRIDSIVKKFTKLDGNYLKFLCSPRSKVKVNNYFNELPAGSIYRATAVCALWNKKVLSELLLDAENPWEFEVNGSERSDDYSKFYVVAKNEFQLLHGVIRGNFLFSSYKKIIKDFPEMKSAIDRPVNTLYKDLILKLLGLRHKLFYLIVPLSKRRLVKKILSGSLFN